MHDLLYSFIECTDIEVPAALDAVDSLEACGYLKGGRKRIPQGSRP